MDGGTGHYYDIANIGKVMGGISANNMTKLIVEACMVGGGWTHYQLTLKLVCIGADGASAYQGIRLGVTS